MTPFRRSSFHGLIQRSPEAPATIPASIALGQKHGEVVAVSGCKMIGHYRCIVDRYGQPAGMTFAFGVNLLILP